MKALLRFFCIGMVLMAALCTGDRLAGGGTIETTNGRVIGKVVFPNGNPAPRSQVKLIPECYNPVTDTATISIDTTDDSGRYVFTGVSCGVYTIQSVQCVDRTRAIAFGISLNQDALSVSSMELQRPGAVKVMLPAGATTATACVYVPGSDIAARVTGAGDSVVLDSVPAGKLPSVNYLPENDAQSSVIRYDVQILSGDTVALLNPSWRYARSITLNTTPSGADVRGNVTGFPALIRLTHDNFDFSQAQLGGGDLMFTKPDNTPLPHEIERFDPAAEHAEVWVRIDTVYGNNSAQSIMLYWGASASSATVASNSAAVFDTAASKGGFQGVWHMNGAGNATAYDATGNHYNGVPYGMTASSSVPGAIGLSRQFDGTSSYFVMPNTASSSLNLPENGNYTVSAWANSNFLDARYQGIVYKSNWQYGLQIHSDSTWEFFEYKDGQGWESTMNPATAGSWYNITGVRQGVHQYLYVNGVCVDSIITFGSITNPRITNMDLQIGHCQDGGLEPDRFFNGKIDEVRIANVALNADWIKLCYMNQRADDKLVVFK